MPEYHTAEAQLRPTTFKTNPWQAEVVPATDTASVGVNACKTGPISR